MNAMRSKEALLPIGKYQGQGVLEVDVTFPADSCDAFVEAGIVAPVLLRGSADCAGSNLWLKLSASTSVKECCSRSLEEFELPIEAPVLVLVKRESHRQEVEWDYEGEEAFTVLIPDKQREIDVGEVIRQSLELERPLNPVKPGVGLPGGVEPEEVPLPPAEPEVEAKIDPRWEALRKLRGS